MAQSFARQWVPAIKPPMKPIGASHSQLIRSRRGHRSRLTSEFGHVGDTGHVSRRGHVGDTGSRRGHSFSRLTSSRRGHSFSRLTSGSGHVGHVGDTAFHVSRRGAVTSGSGHVGGHVGDTAFGHVGASSRGHSFSRRRSRRVSRRGHSFSRRRGTSGTQLFTPQVGDTAFHVGGHVASHVGDTAFPVGGTSGTRRGHSFWTGDTDVGEARR
jgi:hypothetical protein